MTLFTGVNYPYTMYIYIHVFVVVVVICFNNIYKYMYTHTKFSRGVISPVCHTLSSLTLGIPKTTMSILLLLFHLHPYAACRLLADAIVSVPEKYKSLRFI